MFINPPTTIINNRRMSTVSLESMEDSKNEKRVRFADRVSVSSVHSPLDQLDSVADYSGIWYQMQDIAVFRDEARLVCREMRRQDEQDPTYNPRLLCLSRHEESRGLEQRTCEERQRRRILARRYIVQAAPKAQSPEQLAALSQRITAWATKLAVTEAQRDFLLAYGESPPSPQLKRSAVQEAERRVRARRATLVAP